MAWHYLTCRWDIAWLLRCPWGTRFTMCSSVDIQFSLQNPGLRKSAAAELGWSGSCSTILKCKRECISGSHATCYAQPCDSSTSIQSSIGESREELGDGIGPKQRWKKKISHGGVRHSNKSAYLACATSEREWSGGVTRPGWFMCRGTGKKCGTLFLTHQV